MALSNAAALSSSKLIFNPLLDTKSQQPISFFVPSNTHRRLRQRISAVHAAEPANDKVVVEAPRKKPVTAPTTNEKWSLESWKSKKALQLPEYPDQAALESVLKTIESFPPIVFAGEARSLEERLGEAALGNAFLLQGGDCAESFKEFSANNIRDTFRILLQMGVVLMFGGQMPVIKVQSISTLSFQILLFSVDFLLSNHGVCLLCNFNIDLGGKNGWSVCKAQIRSLRGEGWSKSAKLQG